jgi:hypothetical protein
MFLTSPAKARSDQRNVICVPADLMAVTSSTIVMDWIIPFKQAQKSARKVMLLGVWYF